MEKGAGTFPTEQLSLEETDEVKSKILWDILIPDISFLTFCFDRVEVDNGDILSFDFVLFNIILHYL